MRDTVFGTTKKGAADDFVGFGFGRISGFEFHNSYSFPPIFFTFPSISTFHWNSDPRSTAAHITWRGISFRVYLRGGDLLGQLCDAKWRISALEKAGFCSGRISPSVFHLSSEGALYLHLEGWFNGCVGSSSWAVQSMCAA